MYVAGTTWPLWPQCATGARRAARASKTSAIGRTRPTAATANRPSTTSTSCSISCCRRLAGARPGRGLLARLLAAARDHGRFLASMTDVAAATCRCRATPTTAVLRLSHRAGFLPIVSLLASCALLFGARPRSKAGALDGKTARLAVERRRGWPARTRCRRGFRPRHAFFEGGHYLSARLRHAARGAPAGRRAPLGYLSIAAHGHADALSFTLSTGGRELLSTPAPTRITRTRPGALLPRHAGAQHGRHRRRRPVGAGRQFHVDAAGAGALVEFEAGAERHASSASTTVTSGSPTRLPPARDRSRRAPAAIEVTDMLRCDREHRVRRSWHFAERLRGRPQGNGLKITAGAPSCFSSHANRSTAVEVHRGGGPEQGGWVSRSFGRKQPCTTVLLELNHFGRHGASHANRLHEGTRLWHLIPPYSRTSTKS